VEADPARLRPNDVPIIEGDPGRIRSELGWTPQLSVEQALGDTLDWWRAELHAGR
jgi:GDP-4-dehydro-6-deoxy-D-mannose reductase